MTILHTENDDVTILLSDDKSYKYNGNEVTILQQEIEKVSILNCETKTSLQHAKINEVTQLTRWDVSFQIKYLWMTQKLVSESSQYEKYKIE